MPSSAGLSSPPRSRPPAGSRVRYVVAKLDRLLAGGVNFISGLIDPQGAVHHRRAWRRDHPFPAPSLRRPWPNASRCIKPPAPYPGMRLTLRMTFNALGEFIGQPRITFMTPGAPEEVQTAYKIAILNSLKDCIPLHFSAGLGAAVAGRPYYFHFVEQRIR